MARNLKKLWYVKREVIASSLKEAMNNKGAIYSIELAEEKLWPGNTNEIGFINGKEKK